jgi:hypothetical protein
MFKFGIKVWSLCASEGWMIHSEPYCGSSTRLEKTNLGQGPDVVLGLVDKGEVSAGSHVFFDNLFTSVPLLEKLSEKGNLVFYFCN